MFKVLLCIRKDWHWHQWSPLSFLLIVFLFVAAIFICHQRRRRRHRHGLFVIKVSKFMRTGTAFKKGED